MIATRYVTECAVRSRWAGTQILQVGRGLSAVLDLLTVLLVYLIARAAGGLEGGNAGGAVLGAAVLQIQQAHFFTSDTFATFFTTLAIYLGGAAGRPSWTALRQASDDLAALRLRCLARRWGWRWRARSTPRWWRVLLPVALAAALAAPAARRTRLVWRW